MKCFLGDPLHRSPENAVFEGSPSSSSAYLSDSEYPQYGLLYIAPAASFLPAFLEIPFAQCLANEQMPEAKQGDIAASLPGISLNKPFHTVSFLTSISVLR